MPNTLEVAKDAIEQFQKVQKHMLIAKEENATKTYDSLKDALISQTLTRLRNRNRQPYMIKGAKLISPHPFYSLLQERIKIKSCLNY